MKGEGEPSPFTHFCHDQRVKLFGSARAVAATARDVAAEYDAHGPHVVGQAHQAIGEQLVAGLFSIHNPYGGRSGPGFYSQIAGLLLGLAFVAMGVQLYSLSTPDGDATVTGSVTQVIAHSGSSTCSLRAEFWVDGVPYETRANHSSSTFCPLETGDAVEIRYHSTNPAEADIHDRSMLWVVAMFPTIGALFVVWSLIALAHTAAAFSLGRRLVRSGRELAAAHPPTSGASGVAAEAREAFTVAVASARGVHVEQSS